MTEQAQEYVAIVTGASAGIGKAIAHRLARGGFSIVAMARRQAPLDALAAELAPFAKVAVLTADASMADAAEQAVALAISRFGRLDALINNAGSGKFAPLRKTDDAMVDELFDLSLKAPFRFIRAASGAMAAGGSIINIGSTFGLIGGLNGGMYSAIKAGLVGLTRSAAIELGPRGIRCNLVAPSVVRTAMVEDYWETEPFRRVNQEFTPFNRMGTPEDIANAVHFLASDEGSFINGQVLAVDGGWSTSKYLSREAVLAQRVDQD